MENKQTYNPFHKNQLFNIFNVISKRIIVVTFTELPEK